MKKFNDNDFDKFFRDKFYELEQEPPISVFNRLNKNITSENTIKPFNKYFWLGGLSLAIITFIFIFNSFNTPNDTIVSKDKPQENKISNFVQSYSIDTHSIAQEQNIKNPPKSTIALIQKQTNSIKASKEENNYINNTPIPSNSIENSISKQITQYFYRTNIKAASCHQANGKASIKCEHNSSVQFYWADMNKVSNELDNLKSGTYTVYAKIEKQILDTLLITIPDSGNVIADFKIYDIMLGNEFMTIFENQSKIDKKIWKEAKNMHFYWSFGDGTYSNLAEPEHSYQNSGSYQVKLTLTSSHGCRDSITKSYIVTIPQNFAEIPNIFSPNNDGINDYFQPTYYDMQTIECSIFSRNGELIYEWKEIDGKWDGKIRNSNQIASPGTYYYILKGITKKGKQVLHKGMVQLVL
ncbi:MAG: gliding motility-associated C-terminal domain-containing protein [Bacteroidales bacterium]|nr:gliding motility-associated C-terminal domain-containing protein [Bacteroidales bacterium]